MSDSQSLSLGERVRIHRVHAGMSQETLADASGVSVRTISDLERGQRRSAHLETIGLLADALSLDGSARQRLLEVGHPTSQPERVRSHPASRLQTGVPRWSTSLPTPASPLIGREGELEQLLGVLAARTGEIVTLTGPGGVGKTRLAIEAARQHASTLADGVIFVDLASVTHADLALNAIARAVGVTSRSPNDLDPVVALLATRQLMLILDNMEHVLEAAPYIAALDAACPDLLLLVTSRARLRISREREVAVPPLALADANAPIAHLRESGAVQLFAARARRTGSDFELSDGDLVAAAEVCRQLDGLPLAIELVASHLRLLPLATLLERLDRRLPLLANGERDRPPRQQSMRATIAWSYELLDLRAQRLFQWMSVSVAGLALDAIETLGHGLGLQTGETLETVTILVDCGLVSRSTRPDGEPRFVILETIREFGLEQLTAAGELAAARFAHALHFLEFAARDAPTSYQPIPVAWVGRLAGEHSNLLVAFDWLCQPETSEQSLRFAVAMGPYWHTRGPFSEWEPRLHRALELTDPAPTIRKAHALFWLSLILGTTQDLHATVRTAQEGIEIAEQVGSVSDRAAAIQMLAWVYDCHERWDLARTLREQAIVLWESVGNRYMHAMCLALNGGVAYSCGALDLAQREVEQAETMFHELENVDWTAATVCQLGVIAVDNGRPDIGAAYFESSLRTWMQSESASRWFKPLIGLADVASAIEQFATAARLLGAADAMLLVGGRAPTRFERPGYERAQTRCQDVLESAEFERLRSAGGRLSPDEWLLEAAVITETARSLVASTT